MTSLTVAALQLALNSADERDNIAAVGALVEEAAADGAQVVLPPELFSGPYFCKTEDEHLFELARPTLEHPSVIAMRGLARALKVAIPPTVGFSVQVVKNTALASIVGFIELTRAGQIVSSATFQPLQVYLTVAAIYFVICSVLSYLSRFADRRINTNAA